MTKEELIAKQIAERTEILNQILESGSPKKLIVAGAGTGKTFTFGEVLKSAPGTSNIAMTFIRMLALDMESALGELAEVKTFHAYCKKVLHEHKGMVNLEPKLTEIVELDAKILEPKLADFDTKFQKLEEDSEEVKFYLERGDYYAAVSFNDSVYRLYRILIKEPELVPTFDQILIDEFQDFNLLEVAFINELEKKGKILIVGDDDQAVYDGRCASSSYIREKFNSNDYEIHQLPFCSRCTQVIVDATNAFIKLAQSKGHLQGRIPKRYECFVESKDADSTRFPKIITAQCAVGRTVVKYVRDVIENVDIQDLEESWTEDYPTILIIGPKQYLSIIKKDLIDDYPQLVYKYSDGNQLSVCDGYKLLLRSNVSNLGWRILVEFYFKASDIKEIITKSQTGEAMSTLLNEEFISKHKRATDIIALLNKEELTEELDAELKKIVDVFYDDIIKTFKKTDEEEEIEIDKSKPSIMMTSFVGCKGLSAGKVIVVGANNGSIPKDSSQISDTEISQFIVALTRTRKECHIISNKWLVAPVIKKIFQTPFEKSSFINWIHEDCIEDLGNLKAKDIG